MIKHLMKKDFYIVEGIGIELIPIIFHIFHSVRYRENQRLIPGIPPYSFTTQIHFVNTAPRCGVYSIKQKTKLSNNRQHRNKTRGCNAYIRASQTSSQTLPP
jgi:hypothetical protein